MQLVSDLTCPACGFTSSETMPTQACQYYFECRQCNLLITPKTGDCCVFCSHGTMPCPPIQADLSCCEKSK